MLFYPKNHRTIDGIKQKFCNKCKTWKNLEFFNKCKKTVDGLYYKCRECDKSYQNTKHKSSELFKKPHIIVDGIEKKECCKCREIKPLIEFNKSRQKWDGLKPYCKKCSHDDYQANRIQRLAKSIETQKKNKEKRNKYKLQWKNHKLKTDIKYRLIERHRKRVCDFIKHDRRSLTSLKLLGCSPEEFKQYIAEKFTEGMSWENYGLKGWHLDHIIPCCSFNLQNEDELKKCFHFTNYQPLWAKDNLSKGGRIIK